VASIAAPFEAARNQWRLGDRDLGGVVLSHECFEGKKDAHAAVRERLPRLIAEAKAEVARLEALLESVS